MEIEVLGLAIVAICAVIIALILVRRGSEANSTHLAEATNRLSQAQSEFMGRLSHMADSQATTQKLIGDQLQAQERAVTKMIDERLAEVTRRVGENLQKTGDKSAETMAKLHERLAEVLDAVV